MNALPARCPRPLVFLFLFPLVGISRSEEPLSLLGRHELTCPVCRQDFTALTCTRSNTRGGVDRDLFPRALGPQPEFYRIATCPRCGYSGYGSDFDALTALSEDFRNRVLEAPGLPLPSGFGPESDPGELDAADRYQLAITCYRWRGQSDEALGWLHLRASWVAREEGSVLPPDNRLERVFKFAERWRPVLGRADNQADGELRVATFLAEAALTGRFNTHQRSYAELATALILRRHGENTAAAAILDRLAAHRGFGQALSMGIARLRDSIQRERRQQAQAAECFERAVLGGQISEANRGPACYLLAELYRRLGRERSAIRWYDQAMDDRRLPAQLAQWAAEQRRACFADHSP